LTIPEEVRCDLKTVWRIRFNAEAGRISKFFGATLEQAKNRSELLNANEATTWIDIAYLEGRRSIQLSYGRILGYSLDSTKDVTPIRHPIVPNLGAFGAIFKDGTVNPTPIFSASARRRSNSNSTGE
jgi:hypothetical protein